MRAQLDHVRIKPREVAASSCRQRRLELRWSRPEGKRLKERKLSAWAHQLLGHDLQIILTLHGKECCDQRTCSYFRYFSGTGWSASSPAQYIVKIHQRVPSYTNWNLLIPL